MEDVYNDLNIKYRSLGCSMLKVDPVPVSLDDIGGEDVLYISKNKDLPWVNGFINGKKPHITLLYGLLENVCQKHVDVALANLEVPKTIKLTNIGTFPSQLIDEPYICIVVNVDIIPLIKFHEKLCMLPNIKRYPIFKAHLTIAYVKKEFCTQELLDKLNKMCSNLELNVKELKFEPANTVI